MNIPSLVIGLAAGLFIGILACILYRNKKAKDDKAKIANAEEEALRIINDAIKSAESKKREATLEAKEEILRSRTALAKARLAADAGRDAGVRCRGADEPRLHEGAAEPLGLLDAE